MDVTSFSGPYRFLSNFYPVKITYEGSEYPSVEHAYQAAKTLDLNERKAFQDTHLKAGEAKKMGKSVNLRADWQKVNLSIMESLVLQKFVENNALKEALCAIDGVIIEGNYWGDTFWGESPLGTGENQLGKIIMKVRDILNESK